MMTTAAFPNLASATVRTPRPQLRARRLPTAPCSVVWSHGRAFVLETVAGGSRWVGFDAFGRPLALTAAALDTQGWSSSRRAS